MQDLAANLCTTGPDSAIRNRLFTAPGTANTASTTHSQRDVDCHGNGGIVESDSDAQRGTVMSDTRNAVVESHSGRGAKKAKTDIASATASSCPEDPQTHVTDERPVVSFANDDVVIPPSETVDAAKIEDKDTTEEMYSDSSNDFTTASHTYRTSADVRTDRRMLPQRRDMIGKPIDGRIATGAHSDGLPIGNSIRARGDRRISGGVSSRIERAEFPLDCSFCLTDKKSHVLRRPPQKSTSRNHSSTKSEYEYNQTVTTYSSDKKPRTLRQVRTPIRTGKKAKKSDFLPRISKRGASPRSNTSLARRSRTDSTEKTVKENKHGDSHCQRPSTDDIFPRRPDNSKFYHTYRQKKGPASSSFDSTDKKGTDTDTIKESLSKGRKRSPLPREVRYQQCKSRDRDQKGQSSSHHYKDREESLSPSHRHKNHRERKAKLPDTVRYRQEDATDSDSTNSSSSSKTDSEKGRPVKVHHFKHILKPPKFDGVRSFESFWAQFCNCVEHNKWNRQQQSAYLRSTLEGKAASVLWDYGDEVTGLLTQLTATLKKSFGRKAFADKYRIKIRNRRRHPKETLQTLHANIRRMAALAFPSVKHQMRKVMATDYFLDALEDTELASQIRERNPVDLDAALRIALQLEVWTKNSYRLQQVETPRPAENKKSREISKTGQPSALKKMKHCKKR